MKTRNEPTYLIVGAMKCGTSALQDFICLHPDVVPPKQKEIHYFSLYPYKSREWYRSFFVNNDGGVTGEASPTYFDVAITASIPEHIKSFNSNMKIILIFRDPVLRAISHFNHLKQVAQIPDLASLSAEEFFSPPLEVICSGEQPAHRYAKSCIEFSLYLEKYYLYKEIFGRNILVIANADLLAKPQLVMDKVFDFLELSRFNSDLFRSFRYSTGTSASLISDDLNSKLKNILRPGYEVISSLEGFSTDKRF